MSRAKTIKSKKRKAERTLEEKEFARKVKQGLLVRRLLARDPNNKNRLERRPAKRPGQEHGGLTLRLTTWPKAPKESVA